MTTRSGTPAGPGTWVMLSYRLRREPSTPRITVWRKLKRLGVAQLGDGVIALPADARTREHLEWIAEDITDAGGQATIWLAQPTTASAERDLAKAMATARAAEYTQVIAAATTAAQADPATKASVTRRLRAELRRIHRRDYFPPPERDTARHAVHTLTEASPQPTPQQVALVEEHT